MFARGFLGVVPTKLIATIVGICRPQEWSEVYCACSGTFRTERGLISKFPDLCVRSNDVSLLSTALGRAAVGDPLRFAFKGELAFIEELQLTEPVHRVAAVLMALTYSTYAKGRSNRFKAEHLAHLRGNFASYVVQTAHVVHKTIEAMPIRSYFAGDFRDHIEAAISAGAGVIAYPPTFKGGYEKLFDFVHANVDWQEPSYRVFDPKTDVVPVLERLTGSGIPFFLYLDQEVEGFEPVVRFEQPGKRTIFGYGRARAASYRTSSSHAKPFSYKAIDLTRITRDSRFWVLPAPEAHIAFLREAFLKKGILFGSGDFGVLVYLDEMLVGAISYRKPMSAGEPLFVLTDLVVTREGRLAKLVARAATCREAFGQLERKMIVRFKALRTTVFSEHPEAMKYRGSWAVEKREETNGRAGRYKISYGSAVRDESLAECFGWWWKRDGEREVAAARSRAPEARSENPQAA